MGSSTREYSKKDHKKKHKKKSSRSIKSSGSGSGSSSKHDHKKKRRKRSRSSSSSGYSSSDSFSSSSSEEDEKTKRKNRKKAEKILSSFGYSNETNPFGDSNLSTPFVWGKKYESSSNKKKPSEKEIKRQQFLRVEEIQKAKKRREEREAEKEEMERLRTEEMRLKDAEQYEDWQQKEEEFHLTQAKVRSTLRLKSKREKPIDLLAKNMLLVANVMQKEEEDQFFLQEDVLVEKRKPYALVQVLSLEELKELLKDIDTYQELEAYQNQTKNVQFWKLLKLITRARVQELEQLHEEEEGINAGAAAIHTSVHRNITEMLEGKKKEELEKLQKEVQQTIASSNQGSSSIIDVEYWEEVLKQIQIYQARGQLDILHEEMLDQLSDRIEAHETQQRQERQERQGRQEQQEQQEQQHQKQTRSPTKVSLTSNKNKIQEDESKAAKEFILMEEEKQMEENEEQMALSEEIEVTKIPTWATKYQPRKPKYFNRVKTGYDWNKYNQTHYDHDNPPPKIVQGYKFNLFYPDLIDKHTSPKFYLEKTSSSDFCIIRFSAGPPYQDIAFKIVNREWEYSHKRGFKSVFERGILHLYFNFKRHRYRR